MDIFNNFLNKFSYKFDKGYPDMDDPKDILLLESLLSETLGKKITLEAISRSKSIEAAKDFVDNSKFAKDNEVKKFTSYKYANRISSSKEKDLDKIKKALIDHFNITDAEIAYIEPGTGPSAKYFLKSKLSIYSNFQISCTFMYSMNTMSFYKYMISLY